MDDIGTENVEGGVEEEEEGKNEGREGVVEAPALLILGSIRLPIPDPRTLRVHPAHLIPRPHRYHFPHSSLKTRPTPLDSTHSTCHTAPDMLPRLRIHRLYQRSTMICSTCLTALQKNTKPRRNISSHQIFPVLPRLFRSTTPPCLVSRHHSHLQPGQVQLYIHAANSKETRIL